jgi:ABC-type multidrug transport system ATPase subunit
MDEAERCQRVVYLAGGRLVVQGTADDVVSAAKLVTFEATGDGIEQAARRLRRLPGVETAAVFGRALRIAGMDRAALRAAIDSLGDEALHWQEVEPRLDDVFIHMLRDTEA